MQIAAEIEALIGRLSRARAILATLAPMELPVAEALARQVRGNEPPPAAPAATEVAAAPPAPPKPRAIAVPPRAQRMPRAPRRRSKEPMSSALRGAVPQGPVAVSAADAVRQRAVAEPAPAPSRAPAAKDAGHSLDDLVRELARRTGAPALEPPSHP